MYVMMKMMRQVTLRGQHDESYGNLANGNIEGSNK